MFGHRKDEAPNAVDSVSDGETTGVRPIEDVNGDTLGHDKFIFRQNLNNLNLPDGEHTFIIKCKDVNDNNACLASDGMPTSVDFIRPNLISAVV